MQAKRMGLASDRLAGILYPVESLVVQDKPVSANFGLDRIEFVPVLKQEESCISGKEFLGRVKTLGGEFGLCDIEVLIGDQQNLSTDLRDKEIYFVAARVFNPTTQEISIPYMAFSENRQSWVVRFHSVGIYRGDGDGCAVMVSIFYSNSLVPRFKA